MGNGVIAVTYLSLAIPFLQTMKLDCGKGRFFIKRKKGNVACRSTYVYGGVVIAKPIILNICADMFLL
jgi:hypothetical protein